MLSKIENRDIVRAQADDAAADLGDAVARALDYMNCLKNDLENHGAEAVFAHRGDMLDSLVKIWQGVAVIDSLMVVHRQIEEFQERPVLWKQKR